MRGALCRITVHLLGCAVLVNTPHMATLLFFATGEQAGIPPKPGAGAAPGYHMPRRGAPDLAQVWGKQGEGGVGWLGVRVHACVYVCVRVPRGLGIGDAHTCMSAHVLCKHVCMCMPYPLWHT